MLPLSTILKKYSLRLQHHLSPRIWPQSSISPLLPAKCHPSSSSSHKLRQSRSPSLSEIIPKIGWSLSRQQSLAAKTTTLLSASVSIWKIPGLSLLKTWTRKKIGQILKATSGTSWSICNSSKKIRLIACSKISLSSKKLCLVPFSQSSNSKPLSTISWR